MKRVKTAKIVSRIKMTKAGSHICLNHFKNVFPQPDPFNAHARSRAQLALFKIKVELPVLLLPYSVLQFLLLVFCPSPPPFYRLFYWCSKCVWHCCFLGTCLGQSLPCHFKRKIKVIFNIT